MGVTADENNKNNNPVKKEHVGKVFGGFFEMITSEQSYNANVKTAISQLQTFINKTKNEKYLLKAKILQDQLEKISQCSDSLLNCLKTLDLDGCIKIMSTVNNLYGEYVLLQSASLSDISFTSEVDKCNADDQSNVPTLASLLIQPIQRPLRYPIMLREILPTFARYTDENDKHTLFSLFLERLKLKFAEIGTPIPQEPTMQTFIDSLTELDKKATAVSTTINENQRSGEKVFKTAKLHFKKALSKDLLFSSAFDSTWIQMQYLWPLQYFTSTLTSPVLADNCYYVNSKAQLKNLPSQAKKSSIIFIKNKDESYSVVFFINGKMKNPHLNFDEDKIKMKDIVNVDDSLNVPIKIHIPTLTKMQLLPCYQVRSLEDYKSLPKDLINCLLIMPDQKDTSKYKCCLLVNGKVLKNPNGSDIKLDVPDTMIPILQQEISQPMKIEDIKSYTKLTDAVNATIQDTVKFHHAEDITEKFREQLTHDFLQANKTGSQWADNIKLIFLITQKLSKLPSREQSQPILNILQIIKNNVSLIENNIIDLKIFLKNLNHAINNNTLAAFVSEENFKINLYNALVSTQPKETPTEKRQAFKNAILIFDQNLYAFHKADAQSYSQAMTLLNKLLQNADTNGHSNTERKLDLKKLTDDIMQNADIDIYIKTHLVQLLSNAYTDNNPLPAEKIVLSQEMLKSIRSVPPEVWANTDHSIKYAVMQKAAKYSTASKNDTSIHITSNTILDFIEEENFKIKLGEILLSLQTDRSVKEEVALKNAMQILGKRFDAFYKANASLYSTSMQRLNHHLNDFNNPLENVDATNEHKIQLLINAIMQDKNIDIYIKTHVVRLLSNPNAHVEQLPADSIVLSHDMIRSIREFPPEKWRILNPAVQFAIIQRAERYNTATKIDTARLQMIATNLNDSYLVISGMSEPLSHATSKILSSPNLSLTIKEKLLFEMMKVRVSNPVHGEGVLTTIANDIENLIDTIYRNNQKFMIPDDDKKITSIILTLGNANLGVAKNTEVSKKSEHDVQHTNANATRSLTDKKTSVSEESKSLSQNETEISQSQPKTQQTSLTDSDTQLHTSKPKQQNQPVPSTSSTSQVPKPQTMPEHKSWSRATVKSTRAPGERPLSKNNRKVDTSGINKSQAPSMTSITPHTETNSSDANVLQPPSPTLLISQKTRHHISPINTHESVGQPSKSEAATPATAPGADIKPNPAPEKPTEAPSNKKISMKQAKLDLQDAQNTYQYALANLEAAQAYKKDLPEKYEKRQDALSKAKLDLTEKQKAFDDAQKASETPTGKRLK